MTLGRRVALACSAIVFLILLALAVRWYGHASMKGGALVHVVEPHAESERQRAGAHRAAPPLPADLPGRYASATSFLPMIEGLKQRSRAGDAEASYLLSRIYRDCIWYYDPLTMDLSGVPPERLPGLYRSTAWMAQRCEGIDGKESALASGQYRRVAADQGAFAAQVEDVFDGLRPTGELMPSPDDQKRVIALALSNQDPQAYLALSRVLGYSADGNVAALAPYPAGTQADSAAWMLAACDSGLPCGADSPLLHQLCATGLMCGAGSVADALGLVMSPQELDDARTRAAWLLRNAGRHPPGP